MPSHLYGPQRVPPRWFDVVLAHALELAVAGYSALIGTLVVINAQNYGPGGVGILHHLPLYLIYAIGGFVSLGGFIALWGLLVRRNNIRAELNIEQIGWIVLSVGWLGYLYASIRYAGGPSSAVSAGAFIGVGGLIRAAALMILERQLERAVTQGGETHTEEDPTHG